MQTPKIPLNEAERLNALRVSALLDTSPEERFDRLTRLARRMFGTKIALISLVDSNRQWFKSRQGLDACETGRDISFCGHAILDADIFHIPNASLDPRFADNPLVTGPPHIRFYAGAPLRASGGYRIGTLCIIDNKPRQLTAAELASLRDLADCVEDEINQLEITKHKLALNQSKQMMDVIAQTQSEFISDKDRYKVFNDLLSNILTLTASEYGFIGEVLHTAAGKPYLKTYAITNIAWNEATRNFYDTYAPRGMEFFNLDTLFGAVLSSAEGVIANDPAQDPRRGGLPDGHPALTAFLGLPVQFNGEMVGVVGVANRPGGYDQSLVEYLRPLLITMGQMINAMRSQQRQHEGERRLAAVIEGTGIGTWEWNVLTGEININNRWAEILGYTLAELEPFSIHVWDELVKAEDISESRAQLERHFSGELDDYYARYRLRHQQGHWVWIQVRGRVTSRTKDGAPQMMYGIVADISEQKAAESLLEAKQSELQNLFDLSNNFICVANVYGYFEKINQTFMNVLGYSEAELLQQPFMNFIHPDDHGPTQHEVDKLENGELTISFVNRFRRKHGDYVSLMWNAAPDTLTGKLYAIGTDITQQQLAERALREQVEQTQAIVNNIIDGIIIIDRDGLIVSINPAVESIFGYSAEDLLGQNVSMLMLQPHRQMHDSFLHQYHETGMARIIGVGREVEGLRKDGSLFPMDLAVSEVHHHGSMIYIGVVRDISERKRIERMKNEFVSTVSHELRTPLTAISGALGLISGNTREELPEQLRTLVQLAYKNSQRLTALINDLLDMEKIAAGKMHFDMRKQQLMPLIRHAVEINQAYGSSRRVSMVITSEVGDVEVRVDSQRLMQIMSNLLSNAMKFSPEGGTVEIAVQLQGKSARISVIDHGPGIPAAFRDHIFQKFAQADASDSRKLGGTGLGLAITRELVDHMGGKIDFESAEGQGASFYVNFPVIDVMDVPRNNITLAMAGSRVLVVEDDEDSARILLQILSNAGYAVDLAYKGRDALRAVQRTRYDAMILDLMLPDMNGIEVIRELRRAEATARLPVVVVSARMEDGRNEIEGDSAGIDWLSKPIDEAQLISIIQRLRTSSGAWHPRLLHVEDDNDLRQVVKAMIGDRYDIAHAATHVQARRLLVQERYDVVLLDFDLQDDSGWQLLPMIRDLQPQARVVILTGNEMMPDEAPQVDAVLLKSRASTRALLEAIQTSMLAESKKEYNDERIAAYPLRGR